MKCQYKDFQQTMLLVLLRLQRHRNQEKGYVMVVVIVMLLILTSLLAAYMLLSKTETSSAKASTNSNAGFYSAEAGLNLRAKQIQDKFVGFNTPQGDAPSTSPNAWQNCIDNDSTNDGSDDLACKSYTFNNQKVVTYVQKDTKNPYNVPIPSGEPFAGLSAQEYRYDVISVALDSQNQPTAIQGMRFKSRLVPMFQFLGFYNGDLEITNPPNMNLTGRMHTNGDMYLNAIAPSQLTINGQISATGTLYSGIKFIDQCDGSVYVHDTNNQRQLGCKGGATRIAYPNSDLTAWKNRIITGINTLTVPLPDDFDATPGKLYWDKADLRIVLKLDPTGNPSGIEVRNQDKTVNTTATNNLLQNCPASTTLTSGTASNTLNLLSAGSFNLKDIVTVGTGLQNYIINTKSANTITLNNALGTSQPTGTYVRKAIASTSNTFFNNREKRGGSGTFIRMLDVDVQGLFDCIQAHKKGLDDVASTDNKELDDETDGGLVWFLTVDGPNSNTINNYGVRVRNGSDLKSTVAGAPAIKGLTIVSDQAVYIKGDYNSSINKKPAAFLADTINILSNNWNMTDSASTSDLSSRTPTNTTINAAFLSGMDTTVKNGGQSKFNGGLNNYPRFHENWNSSVRVSYRGSFVTLGAPRRVNGSWCGVSGSNTSGCNIYTAPLRDWDYDTDFDNAANLPPLTPRVVYLRQEVFSRSFDR